ncbi:MAG: DUF1364 domain-containing protein [Candidatus Berkelbacteria bacterium]|nr:DUF1364 domain-containing protein [Candidatus Berkelbacteria bacterium]
MAECETMSKITAAAQGRPCTIRLPGCNGDPATSVWAHINSIRWGAGRGHKVNDLIGVIACSACHDILDGRVKTTLERDFIKLCALEGHCESLYILTKEGII